LSNFLLSKLIPYADEIIENNQCGFGRKRSATDQMFYVYQILKNKWNYNGIIHKLFLDFKKACDSVRREALYNILTEFGLARKLNGLIKMCLNETYSRVRIGKSLSVKFTIQNGLKQEHAFHHCISNLFGICYYEGPKEPGRTEIEAEVFDLC
jgi:hypothetical protein